MRIEQGKRLRVLFIGNSYTYFHNSYDIFVEIAAAEGYPIDMSAIYKGGWTLEKMADATDECGAQVERAFLEEKFDVVFMQEQSLRPAIDPERFYAGARALCSKVKANGAWGIFFETWGRHTASPDLDTYAMTNKTMTERLVAAYEKMAEEHSFKVSHVGKAFYDVHTNHPEIEIYDNDKTHPSYYGSVLIALTHYATLYGRSPIGIGWRGNFEKPQWQHTLEQAAHRAVFGG